MSFSDRSGGCAALTQVWQASKDPPTNTFVQIGWDLSRLAVMPCAARCLSLKHETLTSHMAGSGVLCTCLSCVADLRSHRFSRLSLAYLAIATSNWVSVAMQSAQARNEATSYSALEHVGQQSARRQAAYDVTGWRPSLPVHKKMMLQPPKELSVKPNSQWGITSTAVSNSKAPLWGFLVTNHGGKSCSCQHTDPPLLVVSCPLIKSSRK